MRVCGTGAGPRQKRCTSKPGSAPRPWQSSTTKASAPRGTTPTPDITNATRITVSAVARGRRGWAPPPPGGGRPRGGRRGGRGRGNAARSGGDRGAQPPPGGRRPPPGDQRKERQRHQVEIQEVAGQPAELGAAEDAVDAPGHQQAAEQQEVGPGHADGAQAPGEQDAEQGQRSDVEGDDGEPGTILPLGLEQLAAER